MTDYKLPNRINLVTPFGVQTFLSLHDSRFGRPIRCTSAKSDKKYTPKTGVSTGIENAVLSVHPTCKLYVRARVLSVHPPGNMSAGCY